MNDMYDDLEITMLNGIKSLISMVSCPNHMSESEFVLSKHIQRLEHKLVTHMSYRICGNNIENQLSYLKSEEDRLYNAMRSYTNLSDTYDEVDKRELIYRYNAIRASIIECKTIIAKQYEEEQKKQEEEQKKQEEEEEKCKTFKLALLALSLIAGFVIIALIFWGLASSVR